MSYRSKGTKIPFLEVVLELPQSEINSYFRNILHGENSQEAGNAEQLAEPNASDR